jgi:hypothetical protein
MVTIISRESAQSPGSARIVDVDYCAMHLRINTRDALVHRSSTACIYGVPHTSRVNILSDPWGKIPEIADGTPIPDAKVYIDSPWAYQRLFKCAAASQVDSADNTVFSAFCVPSVVKALADSGLDTRATRVTYGHDATDCDSVHEARDGMQICVRERFVHHVHVESSAAIPSVCARFIFEHVAHTGNGQPLRGIALTYPTNFQCVWIIGADYYMSMLPVAKTEYDRYIPHGARLRMTDLVAREMLGTASDAKKDDALAEMTNRPRA